MFGDEFSKDEKLEKGEHDDGQQHVVPRQIRRVGDDADAQNVKAGQAPDEAGDQKQCILFDFHKKDSFLNIVHFEAKKHPVQREVIQYTVRRTISSTTLGSKS